MDQSKTKTKIPHFLYASKFTSSMWKLRCTRINSSWYWNLCLFFCIYLNTHIQPISTLMDIFATTEDLPSTLYLQMNICYRENKNSLLTLHYSIQMNMKSTTGITRNISKYRCTIKDKATMTNARSKHRNLMIISLLYNLQIDD